MVLLFTLYNGSPMLFPFIIFVAKPLLLNVHSYLAAIVSDIPEAETSWKEQYFTFLQKFYCLRLMLYQHNIS